MKTLFWKLQARPRASVYMRGVAFLWLFDAHQVALHHSVNPLVMFVNTARAIDASVVYADVPSSSAGGLDAAAASAPSADDFVHKSGRCAVRSTRHARLSPYAVVRRDAWDEFYRRALARMAAEPKLGYFVAMGVDELICGVAASHFRDRPACAAAATPAVHLLDRGATEAEALVEAQRIHRHFASLAGRSLKAGRRSAAAGSCAGRRCVAALKKAFGANVFSGTTTAEIPITNTNASSTRSRLAQCWLIAGPQRRG